MHILLFKRIVIAAVLPVLISLLPREAIAITLDEAIRASLVNSKSVAAARQNWIATREAVGINTSTSDLSARLTSTGTLANTDEKAGSGFKKSQSLSTGITLSKNIYDGGQTRENVRLAQLNLQMASAAYAKNEQVTILMTIEAYLSVLKIGREVKLFDRNLNRLKAHVDAAKIRVNAGAATPTRLAEAKARFARAQSDAILTQTRLANAEDNFRSVTGVDGKNIKQPALAKDLPADLLSAETIAQKGHPDMLSAIAAERVANQAFNTFKAAVRPTLTLSVSADSRIATGASRDKDEVAAELVFSSPLLSTNATRSKARNIAANYEVAKLNRAETTRKIKLAARETFRNWKTTAARVNAVISEIKAFRLVAKGIASEAQFGQKTMLDLFDAEKDVNDSELSLVKAEHNQFLAAFRLKAAIGDLTAKQMGLGDVLGPLQDLPNTKDPFQNTFPFRRTTASD